MAREYTAKVVIIGDISVGKTCLLLRFSDNKFPLSPVITINNDFKKCRVQLGDSQVTMELWDTAGQERYKSLTSRFFRGSYGVILMYDVTNLKSFSGVQNWLTEVEYHDIPLSRCILVGNKTDLSDERVVEHSQAAAFANRHGLVYMETSVKDDVNVQQAFLSLARQMVGQMKRADTAKRLEDDDEGQVIIRSLKMEDSDGRRKKRKGCRRCQNIF